MKPESNGHPPRILIIGALPPPAIGPTMAMKRLVEAPNLQASFDIQLLDISDRRGAGNIGEFDFGNLFLGIQHVFQCLWILIARRPKLVYIGISQGLWGYLRDLGFILPSLLLRKQLVIHLRGSEFQQFYCSMGPALRSLTRAVFRRVSQVIVLGSNLRHIFQDLVPADRIVVIPNGIRYADYDITPASQPSDRNGPRLLFLATLKTRKGVFLLLEALPEVFKKHPNLRVSFAGKWRDPAEEKKAHDLLNQFGMKDRCEFLGEISGDHKIQTYRGHDLFVFPPIEPEGLPWVLLEAMSARLPVVTTDQGAIREVVTDGQTGFIVPPEPKALAVKICELVESPQRAAEMGAAGRRRVETHFSEDVYFSRIESVFRTALRQP